MLKSLVFAYQRSHLSNKHAAQMMHEYDMAAQLSAQSQRGCVLSSACLWTSKLQSFLHCNGMLQKQLHTLILAS